MRFGSVCSGIEAASVAWNPLGWEADWFAELDRAASQVLAHRFPDIPNHGDMTLLPQLVLSGQIAAPDILVGGTPCQAFSIAGRREGLADERGQLTLAYVDLADAIDRVRKSAGEQPCVIVWENVPGVLSSKDNAFGCFLAVLAGADEPAEPGPRPESGRSSAHWSWEKKAGIHRPKWPNAGYVAGPKRAIAWRVQDAQYHRLAQRRRRVFLVASARTGFDPGAILFEFEGVRRDTPPSRETGEGVAGTLDARTEGGGFPGTDGACCGHVVPAVREFAGVVSPTLRAGGNSTGGDRPPGTDVYTADSLIVARAPLVMAHGQAGAEITEDFSPTLNCNHEAPICFDTTQITSPGNYSVPRAGDPCHPLAAGAHPPSVAYAFQPRIARNGRGDMGDIVNALTAQAGETGKGDSAPCVAYAEDVCVTAPVTHTLKGEGFDASEDGTGRGQPIVAPTAMAVRRLMPIECERLQGFPDNWTLVPTGPKGKMAADGPRYKQLGNSMATHCMNWLGRRIQAHLGGIGHNGGPDFEGLLG